MEYVNQGLERRILRISSNRRFSIVELILIVLFILTIYTFLLVSAGANSVFFCSNIASSSGQITYINCDGYSANTCSATKYETVSEYDRMVRSLKLDLLNLSKKMKEVNFVIDSANKEIPEKQQELVQLGEEIEAAQRSLDELRDRRNVRIFLPRSPLYSNTSLIKNTSVMVSEFSFDFSRCSISSFLPIFLESPSNTASPVSRALFEQFKRQANLVDSREKACLVIHFSDPGLASPNDVIISDFAPLESSQGIVFHSGAWISAFGSSLHLGIGPKNTRLFEEIPPLLPSSRKNLLLLFLDNENGFDTEQLNADIRRLRNSAELSGDNVDVVRCEQKAERATCETRQSRELRLRSSVFCIFPSSPSFQRNFWESLKSGCVPVVLSLGQPLPFKDLIDWRLASYRLAASRLPELHFIVRTFDMADIVEMRRNGRLFFEKYLADVEVVTSSILSFLSNRLGVPLPQDKPYEAKPLFNNSFKAPILVPINSIAASDDEYLGPLEGAVDSLGYNHNFSFQSLYAAAAWNRGFTTSRMPQFLLDSAEFPAEAEFSPDSNIGFRPIDPGSGVEFSKALGGNRPREQFTVVMITYNRDAVLTASLERLHRIPYLNKVIVIWNNVGREPVGAWPRLHVPVEFISVSENSLNNRFVPWDRIETEAVLSLDDDIDLKHHEIIFAFRVWRENRDRLVGFPARYHARFGEEMFYNSNHTCQFSLILTGAAFLHKAYLYEYTNNMPAVIRQHVDKVMNCEDIAMNFLVSHLSRKPPIKTTSKWTLRCPTCSETLSQDESHFQERHECMRLFTRIYGYNPLKFTQFRADSVLFKTRLPADKQKCFRYV